MLSPTISQRILAQTKAENEESSGAAQLAAQEQRRKGKKRAETEESNTSKLLNLLMEMKAEMKERDEQIREELRWSDNHLEDQIKKRENNLVAALQQRDEDWREELVVRGKALRAKFREREREFVSKQLKRDQGLLKILEVREKEMEQNRLQKEDAFGYLYKEHQKEIRATIQKRDEEMEASLNYREKLWIERLDMINSNMIRMYNAQGKCEGALNFIGGRQNELIKHNARMIDWFTLKLAGDRTVERPQVAIPVFIPSHGGYQYESVNLKQSKP